MKKIVDNNARYFVKAGMIDYETLDNYAVTAKAISCAMIAFDPNGCMSDIINQDGSLKVPFVTHLIDFQGESQSGRTQSESTIKWWASQNPDVRARVFDENASRVSVSEHLQILHKFIKDNKIEEVYANSPRFDLSLMESLWREMFPNERFPISHKVERDVRTIEQFLFGTAEHRYNGGALAWGDAHNELDDCVRQALSIQAAHLFRNAAIEVLGEPYKFLMNHYI